MTCSNLMMKTIEELEEIIKDQEEMIKSLCDEWAEDDTYIEKLCFKYGFTEDQVWGDSYYTPGIMDKVDLLCSLIDLKNGDGASER